MTHDCDDFNFRIITEYEPSVMWGEEGNDCLEVGKLYDAECDELPLPYVAAILNEFQGLIDRYGVFASRVGGEEKRAMVQYLRELKARLDAVSERYERRQRQA